MKQGKLGIIGNRPQELKGFQAYTFHSKIKKKLKDYILLYNPEVVYTGMALGVEQWAAEICEKNKIPYVAAVPFKHQPKTWQPKQQNKYYYLLKRAEHIFYIDRQIGYINHKPDIYKESKLYAKVDWIATRLIESKNGAMIGSMRKNDNHHYLFKCWQKIYICGVNHNILNPENLEWYNFKEILTKQD